MRSLLMQKIVWLTSHIIIFEYLYNYLFDVPFFSDTGEISKISEQFLQYVVMVCTIDNDETLPHYCHQMIAITSGKYEQDTMCFIHMYYIKWQQTSDCLTPVTNKSYSLYHTLYIYSL